MEERVKQGKQISITLPPTWVEDIDSQVTSIKSRQDIIRENLEPLVRKIRKKREGGDANQSR